VGALGSDIHVASGVTDSMTRKTIAGVDALLTVSEAMRLAAISKFGAQPDRVHTVVNGFNTSVFYPRDQALIRAKFGIPLDEKMIIYVGRFVEEKGLRELIQAFQQLAQKDGKLSLALIGDGVMRSELVSLIDAAGLQGRVRMPGGQPPDQVAEWICASNVLTLPSWSEGYPNVVVEGLACGRPVVATDVGGTSEILNEANGILIEPRKSEVLQRALDQALRADWDLFAIAKSMRRTWDDVAVETLAICKQVAAR
jgi:glycosyltransferase involved in cell wall biosynthesis